MKYIDKYPLRSCWTTLYDVCQDGEGREVSEIPDGAEGDHEGEHHGDVEAVVEALEEPAPVVLEDGPQVLGDHPYMMSAHTWVFDDPLVHILDSSSVLNSRNHPSARTLFMDGSPPPCAMKSA